ncbi:unnamed protein product [Ambrosiozyma monospora]|uniref:Unnamed protein product n=1 Tax=Ambrosiozyma monospora TaxID=43982 RepID=A0ACB5TNV5_AMBMO|nr:unnamed protein product [Ambrosiozyma monospora]
MRITPETIAEAFRLNNPADEFTLSLRSQHIASIENLDTTNDIFEAIDLTDNDLRILDGIPQRLLKLKSLLVARNRIQMIDPKSMQSLPNLTHLSLINNNLKSLDSLKPLAELSSLENLYLLDNPITEVKDYRLWCIATFPNLKILDFAKIKDKERADAKKLMENKAVYERLGKQVVSVKSYHSKEERNSAETVKHLTLKERAELKRQIQKAQTLEETERIANILQRGYY